jgi:hypothetical protein
MITREERSALNGHIIPTAAWSFDRAADIPGFSRFSNEQGLVNIKRFSE